MRKIYRSVLQIMMLVYCKLLWQDFGFKDYEVFINYKTIIMHIMSFLRGVSIGFVLGVLFAPDEGARTRRKLSSAANNIKDDITDTYDSISSTVSRKAGEIKNKANDLLHPTTQGVGEYASQGGAI